MTRPPEKNSKKFESGFTLVEVLVASAIMVILSFMLNRLASDYLLTAKTIDVSSQASGEMMRMLRSIRMTFQTSLPEAAAGSVRLSRERGCILRQVGGQVTNPSINDFVCDFSSAGQSGTVAPSAGVGFKLDDSVPPKPAIAFVNSCEVIPDGMNYPMGRAKLNQPPEDLSQLQNWGALNKVCPAACAANQRPAVKLLKSGTGASGVEQYPSAISGPTDTSALNLWGTVICAAYFKDNVRQLQELYGDNVGGFFPNYLNITAFVARGRFDVKVPAGQSLYVWTHGGDLLEFSATQELSTFKCTSGTAGCGGI